MAKSLLVLDTNVVLDLFHFDDVATRPLRAALDSGHVSGLVTDETREELKRVLAYPEFKLSQTEQDALLVRYRACSICIESVVPDASLPTCTDPDDQKFLVLAATAGAQGLVSKDHAVLKLRRLCAPRFRIMSPQEAARWLVDLSA